MVAIYNIIFYLLPFIIKNKFLKYIDSIIVIVFWCSVDAESSYIADILCALFVCILLWEWCLFSGCALMFHPHFFALTFLSWLMIK